MPFGINNPIPRDLNSETKKATNVLASFVKPNQVLGADQVIPPSVLRRAKGLAIITVLKAGFLFSGRAGSGVIVARLRDGSWSAPAAIAMAGAGAGGLVGVELTDFVFILNSDEAVRSFTEFGTLTFGGNVSVAAGPLGRNAEADASASMGGVAAVFSYSKTKGLFAGISVEGSAIVERRETNRKIYGDNCTSKLILAGKVRPPPMANKLYKILDSRAFNFGDGDSIDNDSEFYGDIPDSFSSSDESDYDRGYNNRPRSSRYDNYDDYDDDDDRYSNRNHHDRDRYDDRDYHRKEHDEGRIPRSRSHWQDSTYDRSSHAYTSSRNRDEYSGYRHDRSERDPDVANLSKQLANSKVSPSSPSIGLEKAEKVVALYTFVGEQKGDLAFKKGDIITVIKKTKSQDDWWTGKLGNKEGIFPANYVELV
ncbi:Ysc84p NDAI_0G05960 [Naumovozyma dairenensis CBS 421]|uniref:SH3 domain-containing protein n=1 Tax=Naumovozyma dairenensis (strain ATCC 10597 / BCRC 20456 / CBS 421 / NBRC 0211 / NRRL Y-12639) TaxID=1071378 RepID=J7REN6_NAUDC|nr:hypothetical protein NDAI_0G05960 [Naumovozyma dairenensis CBS 421]CCK73579.1 hypothetical protein NDAI_0G05960 [Naumovozyma dairenensis CBS 421]